MVALRQSCDLLPFGASFFHWIIIMGRPFFWFNMPTVFLSILNLIKFNLVQNRKENCHHDHISFNLKGNGNIVFSVYTVVCRRFFLTYLVHYDMSIAS